MPVWPGQSSPWHWVSWELTVGGGYASVAWAEQCLALGELGAYSGGGGGGGGGGGMPVWPGRSSLWHWVSWELTVREGGGCQCGLGGAVSGTG